MLHKSAHKIIRPHAGKNILMDIIARPRPPDGHVLMLVDMLAALEFCHRYRRENKIPLTTLHLMIKAGAIMIKNYPQIHYMLDGYKIIIPDSIDIGVSVAGEESVTPVVVIRGADKKSLPELVKEFKEEKLKAVAEENENLEKLRKLGRLIPVNSIRKMIIELLSKRYFIRRMVIGTFQITSLNVKDVDAVLVNHFGTTVLLSIGPIVKRPLVVNDKVEIRPTLYLTWQPDTRAVAVRDCLKGWRLFKRLIEHPTDLEAI